MTINVEEIKKYNAALKQQKDKANKLVAERDYKKSELDRNCKELSRELGIEVTPENIKGIYEEYVVKISNAVKSGNEILKRIQSEEERITAEEVEVPDVAKLDESAFGEVPLFGDMSMPAPPSDDGILSL